MDARGRGKCYSNKLVCFMKQFHLKTNHVSNSNTSIINFSMLFGTSTTQKNNAVHNLGFVK